MLVGAMLQTAAACRAAATGRFLFSSSDFFFLFAGYGILEAAWLCVCFALLSEGNKVLQLMDPAFFAQFWVLGVLSSVQRGMREFPVDTVLAVVDGAVVARQAALRGESQHAVAEFVEVRQQAAAAGCVTLLSGRRLHHGWTWVTPPTLWAQLPPGAVCGLETWLRLGKKRRGIRRKMKRKKRFHWFALSVPPARFFFVRSLVARL